MTASLAVAALAACCGYLIGSVPTPYLIVRAAKGVDLREHATGNVGVMNSGSVLGRYGMVVVLFAEGVKGMAAALVGLWLAGPEGAWVAAIAATVGANWPVFLRGSGGRGNTTFTGGMLVAAPGLVLMMAIVWLVLRVAMRDAFSATRINIVTMPVQVALWSLWQRPPDIRWFYIVTGLVPAMVFLSHHRRETDDHMVLRPSDNDDDGE